jgi:hypothetical protein
MEKQLKAMQVLIDAGIPEAIAAGMVKALEPKKTTSKKKRFYPGHTKREKINVPVIVNQTCMTCKTETSFKRVMQVYSDETEVEQSCIVGQCVNCIKQYELMDKDDLIALIILQNHVDQEIRGMSTASQIKMAKSRSAQEWLTTKMNHAIAWGDKDENDSTEMEGVNLNLR